MKKVIMMLAVVATCLVGMAPAQSIVIVTNKNEYQVQYEAFLKELYPDAVVTLGTFDNIVGNAGQYDTVANADLVVIARNLSSGAYDDNGGAEQQAWNDLETPILSHCSYLSRVERFKWLNGGTTHIAYDTMTIVDAEDTFFLDGVDISSGTVKMLTEQPGNYHVVDTTSSGNGKTIATAPDGKPVLSYWEPFVTYYDECPYNAGGWRVWLPGPENSQFIDILTADGKKVLENAITFLMDGGDPSFNYPPSVAIDAPAFEQVFWTGSAVSVDITATAEDDGNPADPGTLTIEWTADAGVSLSATDTANTTATIAAPGVYTLTLTANDGEKTAVATKTVRVVEDLGPMAYWPMDEIVDANVVVDVIGGNDGVLQGTEPNLVEGVIGTGALRFFGPTEGTIVNEYMLVNINEVAGPNFVDEPVYGASVSAWIKVDAFDGDWQTVISRGDDSWRLARCSRSAGNTNAMAFQCTGVPGNSATPAPDSPGVNDGLWHHVVGVYDGSVIKTYTDGVISSSLDVPNGALINMSSNSIIIGGQDNNGTLRRFWKGYIDDLKVYNYGIAEDSVRAMSAMAMLPPVVQIGSLESPIVYRYGEEIALAGSVDDYGLNGMNDVTVLWTTVSGPSIDTEVTFMDPSNPATTAVFPEFGTYTLMLTAYDNGLGIEVSKEITLILDSPTCQDVIDAGFQQRSDLNNDCYVNLEDLALMAEEWAQCVNPADPECEWKF